jgi:hypothetical protein
MQARLRTSSSSPNLHGRQSLAGLTDCSSRAGVLRLEGSLRFEIRCKVESSTAKSLDPLETLSWQTYS